MAYIKSPLQNKQNLGTQQSGVIGSGSGGATQTGASQSDWTNLTDYIGQNEGAGAGMADAMLNPGEEAAGALSTAGGDFAKTAKDETAKGIKTDTGGYGSLFKSGDMNAVTPTQTAAYKNWASAPAYSGPSQANEVTGYGGLKAAESTAKDAAGRSQTTGGQYGLAKETLGKGYAPYSGGMSMLDTILTRQAGGGQKLDQFNAANTDENISGRTAGITGQVAGGVNAAKAAGTKATQDVQGALQGRYRKEIGNIQSRGGLGGISTGDLASDSELAALNKMIALGADREGYNLNRSVPVPTQISAAAPALTTSAKQKQTAPTRELEKVDVAAKKVTPKKVENTVRNIPENIVGTVSDAVSNPVKALKKKWKL